MDKYISARPPKGNEIPPLCALPLFAWAASPLPAPTLLDIRAERLARLTGRPASIVRIHMVTAGLGGGAR